MKLVKLMIAFGVWSVLLLAGTASAAPARQSKPLAGATAKKMHLTTKAERKVHGHRRPAQHDPQLDYPQLG